LAVSPYKWLEELFVQDMFEELVQDLAQPNAEGTIPTGANKPDNGSDVIGCPTVAAGGNPEGLTEGYLTTQLAELLTAINNRLVLTGIDADVDPGVQTIDDGIVVNSGTAGAEGVDATGNGVAAGLKGTGGTSGRGVEGVAGTGSGTDGVHGTGDGVGSGVRAVGGSGGATSYAIRGAGGTATTAYGVYGESLNGSGTNYGVYGKSTSDNNARGVYGDATGDGAKGVYGSGNLYGVQGVGKDNAAAIGGLGLYGVGGDATGGNNDGGYGVKGLGGAEDGSGIPGAGGHFTGATDGDGVKAYATGVGRGVYAETVGGAAGWFESSGETGLVGKATGGNNVGVFGEGYGTGTGTVGVGEGSDDANAADGVGVFGIGRSGIASIGVEGFAGDSGGWGIIGRGSTGGASIGVYGIHTYGAYSAGNYGGVYGDGGTYGYGVIAKGYNTGTPDRSAFRIVPQDSAPDTNKAQAGDLWVKTSDKKLHIFDGSDWVVVGTQS
jgi:hypothetical protein